jgi:hypothetical protein
MAKLFTILAHFIIITIGAQTTDPFETQLEETLALNNQETKIIQLKILSEAYPKEWLADYYLAQISIKKSRQFILKSEQLQNSLDEAQLYLDKAYLVNNDEAELLILQGKLYLMYIMSNPEVYGRKYAPIITSINKKAYKLAPKNPRVVLTKAEWEMGSAKYFGFPAEEFCKEFDKAVKLFDTFKVKSKLYPKWGLTEAKQAVKNCK